MKTKQRIVGVLVVVAAVAVGAFVWSRYEAQRAAGAVTLYGNVDIREVELAFRVPGRLLAMDFDEGDAVDAGQRVAQIDPEPYREALAVAEARVQQAHGESREAQERHEAAGSAACTRGGPRGASVGGQRRAGLRAAESASSRPARRARKPSTLHVRAAAKPRPNSRQHAKRWGSRRRVFGPRISSRQAPTSRPRLRIASKHETQLDDTELFAPSAGTLIARVLEPGSISRRALPCTRCRCATRSTCARMSASPISASSRPAPRRGYDGLVRQEVSRTDRLHFAAR